MRPMNRQPHPRSGTRRGAVAEKVLLLAVGALMFIPAAVSAAHLASTTGTVWWYAPLAVPALALAGAAAFFFPDQLVAPVAEAKRHRARLKSGHLRAGDVMYLLRRCRPVPEYEFARALAQRVVGVDDPKFGQVVVSWCRRREDAHLLANAMSAGLSAVELQQHLDAERPLDPTAVAMLAGLRDGPTIGGATGVDGLVVGP